MIGVNYSSTYEECADMGWAKPIYSPSDVNWAGKYLAQFAPNKVADWGDFDHSIDIVDNFRAAHAFPLNTLQNRLRYFTNSVDANGLVAQRLKRLSSTIYKLRRFSNLALWDMQDIGGCRAVVASIGDVFRIEAAFRDSDIKHKLVDYDNYILEPKKTGYRSVHLIYSYFSDKRKEYNGMKIEIQIRTPVQHAWATAVETVDLFTRQALKSSVGNPQWKQFFQLMGTVMAFRENTSPVPNTPTDMKELKYQVKECANKLQVVNTLNGFTAALRVTQATSAGNAAFFLLSLDAPAEQLHITGFSHTESKEASDAYAQQESQIRAKKTTSDAVLVSVDSIRNLKRAYPNYFADTKTFVEHVVRTLD